MEKMSKKTEVKTSQQMVVRGNTPVLVPAVSATSDHPSTQIHTAVGNN